MGQYHLLVSMTAHEHLAPHPLGCGLKAWEQTGGGTPAALAMLIAADPGNMPADMGHHPMTGHWAGHRLLAIGDYAEKADLRKFDGPPLNRLYSLCNDVPKLEDFQPYTKQKQEIVRGFRRERSVVITPERQLQDAIRWQKRDTCNGKYPLFPDISSKLHGAIEYAASIRFVGDSYRHDVPVKPYAERGKDGHLHYRIVDSIANDESAWNLTLRLTGLGGWTNYLCTNPAMRRSPPPLLEGDPDTGQRWPWDRPPMDLSWHNATDADQDIGQERLYVNLDRAEYFDPRGFGEIPTTIGIMRAAYATEPPAIVDALVSDHGTEFEKNIGGKPQFGSAAALWAMLLHPKMRGGGDIDPEDFPLIGRWRNCRIALTSEHGSANVLPTTAEVREHYENITAEVVRAALAKQTEPA